MSGIDETLRVYTQLPKCAIMFHISTRRLRSFTNWGPVMQKLLSARKHSQRLSSRREVPSGTSRLDPFFSVRARWTFLIVLSLLQRVQRAPQGWSSRTVSIYFASSPGLWGCGDDSPVMVTCRKNKNARNSYAVSPKQMFVRHRPRMGEGDGYLSSA